LTVQKKNIEVRLEAGFKVKDGDSFIANDGSFNKSFSHMIFYHTWMGFYFLCLCLYPPDVNMVSTLMAILKCFKIHSTAYRADLGLKIALKGKPAQSGEESQ
jgi:hypothetical protein